MRYRKGKQFESAVEMFEWLEGNNTVIYRRTMERFCNQSVTLMDCIVDYKSYSQAIEEKEDEVKEFWLWNYLDNEVWLRTLHFYDDREFKSTKGELFKHLKELPDN